MLSMKQKCNKKQCKNQYTKALMNTGQAAFSAIFYISVHGVGEALWSPLLHKLSSGGKYGA